MTMCHFISHVRRFDSIGFTAVLACAVVLFITPVLADDKAPELLFTSENQGHLEPCASCPMGHGQGGLDRRATALTALRANGAALLIDGGDSLFGGDSAAS